MSLSIGRMPMAPSELPAPPGKASDIEGVRQISVAQVPRPLSQFAAYDSASANTSKPAAFTATSLPPAAMPSPATARKEQMERDKEIPGLRRQSQNMCQSPAQPTAPPPPSRSKGQAGKGGYTSGGSSELSSGVSQSSVPVKNAWMDGPMSIAESTNPGTSTMGSATLSQTKNGGYGNGGYGNSGNDARDPVRDIPRHERLSTTSLDDRVQAVRPADACTSHPKHPMQINMYVITHPIPDRVLDLQATPSSRMAFFNAALAHQKGSLRCVLTRQRQGLGRLQPKFILTSEKGGFLMAAQKQMGKKTPYYIISSHAKYFEKDGEHFLGKFRANMTCTEYMLYGPGRSPKKGGHSGDLRKELLAIRFRKPGNAPRLMEVAMPRTTEDGVQCVHRPSEDKARDSLTSVWSGTENSPLEDIHSGPPPDAPPMLFTNHRPIWYEKK